MTPATPQPAPVIPERDPEAEMVERVAREIYETKTPCGSSKWVNPWESLREKTKEHWRCDARAVIALCRPVYRREGMEMAKRECDRYAENDWKLGEGFRNKAARDLSAAIEKLMEKNDG